MKMFDKADRLKRLPPWLFKELDRKKAEVKARGVDIIDLGVGDPDIPTPDHIIAALNEASKDPANHRYPFYSGSNQFNEVAVEWYEDRFGVHLDPQSEVITLIGSKEGLAHFPLAFVNPGEITLVPSPSYPVYNTATIFAGGKSFFMPLVQENSFLPDLENIPKSVTEKARVIFLNYPNNPTSAVADLGFFDQVVEFAKQNEIIVCNDAAYTELAYDGYKAPSLLQAKGAKDVGLEFHSLSKTYNMTGWRVGFAVGNRQAIEGLGSVKSNIDSGVFRAVQIAGIAAMQGSQSYVREMNELYKSRRDIMVKGLQEVGFDLEPPKATFYLWVKIPPGYTSVQMTNELLDQCGVVVTPGSGFGEPGEGYFRVALTQSEETLEEAIKRIKAVQL
jgi:LL-diaminopimelate aminotransferase